MNSEAGNDRAGGLIYPLLYARLSPVRNCSQEDRSKWRNSNEPGSALLKAPASLAANSSLPTQTAVLHTEASPAPATRAMRSDAQGGRERAADEKHADCE